MTFEPFVEAAIAANRRIYDLLLKPEASLYEAMQRGAGGDMTYGIDQMAEDIFVSHLSSYGRIFSEESGMIGEGENTIFLDPLDGSDNFLSHFPYFGTSVALEGSEGVECGIICNLANGMIFIKRRDYFVKGLLHTDSFSPVVRNRDPKIGIFERAYRSFENANKLKAAKIKYRVPGAVALSLALSHEVSFVLMEGEMRAFDIKAGLFMCEDLYQLKHKDLTIICQHEKMFERLRQIFLQDG
jgi:myo-inositol-1(or 4)-monophosphatase